MSTTIPTREVEVYDNAVVVVENGIEIGCFPVTGVGADKALRHAEMFKASEDMLAALELAEEVYRIGITDVPEEMWQRVNDLRAAAIARARGETP